MFQNEVLFRYRTGVLPPDIREGEAPAQEIAVVGLMNLLSLGFLPSQELMEQIMKAPEKELRRWFAMVQSLIRGSLGADCDLKPMYPNFPRQVIQMPEEEFVIHAMIHYITDGAWIPEFEKEYREPLRFGFQRTLNLCTEEDYHQVFANMMASMSPLSESDREALVCYLQTEPAPRIPDAIPVKETCAAAEVALLEAGNIRMLKKLVRTPTDILRLAAAISKQDVTLRSSVSFGSYPRHIRRLLLELLDRCRNPVEEMSAHRTLWLRLGEGLHPAEPDQQRQYPNAAAAFQMLRCKDLPETFNRKVEVALDQGDTETLVKLLSQRPGVFARQLNYVLTKVCPEDRERVLAAFHLCASKVSSRVLLQVMEFFQNRNEQPVRIFKAISHSGNDFYQSNSMPVMENDLRRRVILICENAVKAQYALRPYLGKVFLSEELDMIAAPLHQREMSDGFRILASGSRFQLPEHVHVLRSFIHWKNCVNGDGCEERTDLDLSAMLLNEQFALIGEVTYYHGLLYRETDTGRDVIGVHSGDFVDAPISCGGASEFVDVDLDIASKYGRYLAISIQAYTPQPFWKMETCFGGWMGRHDMQSGEPFEPSTVSTMFHLTGERTRMPFLVDLEKREVVWLDVYSNSPALWRFANNVETTKSHFSQQAAALMGHKPLSLGQVVRLNAEARGMLVEDPAQADTIFSMDAGITPFNHDQILTLL